MKRLMESLFVKCHRVVSSLGYSLGGSSGCIKAGCEDYCGRSPGDYMIWVGLKGHMNYGIKQVNEFTKSF